MNLSLSQVAEIVNGNIIGNRDKIIQSVAPFEGSTENDITFAGSSKFLKKIEQTSAGAVLVPRDFQCDSKNLIQVDNPQVAFTKILSLFFPSDKQEYNIHCTAHIGKDFKCGHDVSIGPCAVIQNNVTIGNRVTIHPGAVIGNNVEIGDDVLIYPNVSILERCLLGNRVIIHAGTVIGSDGFGFAFDGKIYHKIKHLGIVQIDDDVEIGAGNTIDRATFGKTWIKQGVKTDNLVHIAHNVTIGENTVIVAQVGISGSVTIGKNVVLAGQTGIAGHLTIGDYVMVGGQSGVTKSIPPGQIISGTPEMPHNLWLKVQCIITRLPELRKKILEIEKKINKLISS